MNFAHKLNKYASDWKATGGLSFLNKWYAIVLLITSMLNTVRYTRTYKLGEESTCIAQQTFSTLTKLSLDAVREAATMYAFVYLISRKADTRHLSVDLGVSLRMKYGFLLKVCVSSTFQHVPLTVRRISLKPI